MKPIFGIDITEDKENSALSGAEFITSTASKAKMESLEKKQEEFNQTLEESKPPLWMRIAKTVCAIWTLVVAISLFRTDVSFAEAFGNAPVLILSGLITGIAWVVLFFFGRKNEVKVLAERNAGEQAKALDSAIQGMYKALNVPEDAPSVDVLMFRYVIKDGEPSAKSLPLQTTPYFNLHVKAYVENDTLCLADVENVYSFALSELRKITAVNKRIAVPAWNKDEAPNQGEFKQYKMTTNSFGNVYFKPYYILEIEHNGETWGIYFPAYELYTFEALTGLSAEKPWL